MTLQRRNNEGTQFSEWLRNQPNLDSTLGFIATDIDYVWENYKTGKWYFIEEKRHQKDVTQTQRNTFNRLNKLAKNDKNYCGYYLIQFENTSPDDGKIWLNRKLITKEDLIQFLLFYPSNS